MIRHFGRSWLTRRSPTIMLLSLAACTAVERRPPETAKSVVVDRYPDGSTERDPYRWLEDYQSAGVRRWAASQDSYAQGVLMRSPRREEIRKRAALISTYASPSTRVAAGGQLFYTEKLGTDLRRSLLVAKGGATADRVLYGPGEATTAALDGDIVAFFVSPQGRFVALTVSERAGDWQRIIVVDAASGKAVGEPIRWVKSFGQQVVQWRADGSGFYYRAFPAPDDNSSSDAGATGAAARVSAAELRFRPTIANTPDRLVFRARDAGQLFTFAVDNEKNGLAVNLAGGLSATPILLLDDSRDTAEVVGTTAPRKSYLAGLRNGELFLLEQGKSNGRVVAVSAAKGGIAERTVIAESDAVIRSVEWWRSTIVVSSMQDICNDLRLYSTEGRLQRKIAMPTCGMVVPSPLAGGSATAVQDDAAFGGSEEQYFFQFRSFFDPGSVYRIDPSTFQPVLVEASGFRTDPSRYSVQRIVAMGRDGVAIPTFVIARKGLRLDGSNRVLMTAYGALGNSILPGWSPPIDIALWLELGGVYVQANVRGGGEFGEDWHKAAQTQKRQTSFDDFYAVAKALVDRGYTTPSRLGITGTSNGGLMMAAALTQRPDLFGAVVVRQPVTDMMRYDLFTMGRLLIPEYGSATNPADVQWIRAYSPYQNVAPKAYPPTLIVTGDRDDRAVPLHAFKFAAKMQDNQRGRGPVLLRVYPGVGHGLAKTPDMLADEYGFLLEHLR